MTTARHADVQARCGGHGDHVKALVTDHPCCWPCQPQLAPLFSAVLRPLLQVRGGQGDDWRLFETAETGSAGSVPGDRSVPDADGAHGCDLGCQFTTAVQHRLGNTGQRRWSSLNRSGQPRPELLMRHTYSAEVQQRPLTVASQHDRQHTELAGTTTIRPAAPLVRDEEAAEPRPPSSVSPPRLVSLRAP